MSYDPYAKVAALEKDFDHIALDILDAYNEVDPFNCYYGPNVNPDEYAGYARRYMYHRAHQLNVYESVKNSFWDSQFEKGFLTEEHVTKISNLISPIVKGY